MSKYDQITMILTDGIRQYLAKEDDTNLDGTTHSPTTAENVITTAFKHYWRTYKKPGTIRPDELTDCFMNALKKLGFTITKDTPDTILYHLNFLFAQV